MKGKHVEERSNELNKVSVKDGKFKNIHEEK